MDRAVVHGSTFSKNNLAMAAGLATLEVIEEEELVENAARRGESLIRRPARAGARYEFLKEVRGKGMMIALEFGPPSPQPARRLEAARDGDRACSAR